MTSLLKKAEKKYLGTPSSLSWDDWGTWQKEQKKLKPIAYFLFWTIPAFFGRQKRRIKNFYWWFIHRIIPRHKYHLIDTKLKPGYWEYDQRMLHGCFSLLSDFCEVSLPSTLSLNKKGKTEEQIAKEALDSYIAFNEKEGLLEHSEHYKEIKELYCWWQGRTRDPFYEDDLFEDTTEVDDRMLLRLVKIRGFLWV